MNTRSKKNEAFTLAEVLITLGVIGVVAAVTMPTLVTSIQERVRKEQVRTVKYKLTKATDKMNSLGKIEAYPTTMDFVNELKKHMTIAKICKNNELDKCWPSSEINAYSGSGTTLTSYNPKNLTTGESLKALALSTKSTQTVGIVTGDGVPMLMVYSPRCSGFDEAKTYTWSVEDGKPVTNATTNCISAIFDINGSKGPNKIGTDVRTLNSLFGSTRLGTSSYGSGGVDICNKMKQKYGIQYCNGEWTTNNNDRWIGAIYACDQLGLHLPSPSTLASIANSRYGTTQINIYSLIISNETDCETYINGIQGMITPKTEIICNTNTTNDNASSIVHPDNTSPFSGHFLSNLELSDRQVYVRYFDGNASGWYYNGRNYTAYHNALCVGD